MASKFFKSLALLLPKVKSLYHEIDSLREENYQLRSILKSNDLYYIVGELFKLKSDAIETEFLTSLVLNHYETAELELAKKYIKQNDVVLDLGCGLGISSIVAARAAKTGRVVAFEADPKMVKVAEANAHLNNLNIEVRNKAIAKEPGLIDFFLAKNFQYNSKFPGKDMEKVTIEAVAFQSVINEVKPNVITCDVEGIEEELFESVSMPSVRCVIVETHPDLIGKQGVGKSINDLKSAGIIYQPSLSFGNVIVCLRAS